MSNLFNLDGKVAFVTGAASGIGYHFALTLLRAGAYVIASDINEESLAPLASDMQSISNQFMLLGMDLTEFSKIDGYIANVVKQTKHIDILINNAGVFMLKDLLATTVEDWDHIMDVNVKAVFFLSQAVIKHMLTYGKGGSIINITSDETTRTFKNNIVYPISKVALQQLTRALAMELVDKNIRVNALAPGAVITEMTKTFFNSSIAKTYIETIPIKRVAAVEELDGALLLLASDASSYMTGTTIFIDGGNSCHFQSITL